MVHGLLRGGDCVKLIDFGLAKLPGTRAEDDGNLAGLFLGTPGYAPPEVWSRSDASETRGDVYGIGLVAHHLLTGGAPPDPVETVVHNSRRLVDELGRNAPPWLVSLISRCLSIDPRARFADAGELLRVLPAA
jgi:serine/threonine protein kinase